MDNIQDAEIFARKMKDCAEAHSDDPEVAHIEMDDLLCEKLRELGYGEAVDIYEDVEKWYA